MKKWLLWCLFFNLYFLNLGVSQPIQKKLDSIAEMPLLSVYPELKDLIDIHYEFLRMVGKDFKVLAQFQINSKDTNFNKIYDALKNISMSKYYEHKGQKEKLLTLLNDIKNFYGEGYIIFKNYDENLNKQANDQIANFRKIINEYLIKAKELDLSYFDYHFINELILDYFDVLTFYEAHLKSFGDDFTTVEIKSLKSSLTLNTISDSITFAFPPNGDFQFVYTPEGVKDDGIGLDKSNSQFKEIVVRSMNNYTYWNLSQIRFRFLEHLYAPSWVSKAELTSREMAEIYLLGILPVGQIDSLANADGYNNFTAKSFAEHDNYGHNPRTYSSLVNVGDNLLNAFEKYQGILNVYRNDYFDQLSKAIQSNSFLMYFNLHFFYFQFGHEKSQDPANLIQFNTAEHQIESLTKILNNAENYYGGISAWENKELNMIAPRNFEFTSRDVSEFYTFAKVQTEQLKVKLQIEPCLNGNCDRCLEKVNK